MKISDEVVQTMQSALREKNWLCPDTIVIHALSAVLPKLMVKVPELEWVNGTANTSFGDYDVYRDEDEEMADSPICASHPDGIIGHYPDDDEAKAAAQTDYERRMLQGLEIEKDATVTDGGTKAVDVAAVRRQALEEAMSVIADLETGDNLDITRGHEDAYRAIEALSAEPVPASSKTVTELKMTAFSDANPVRHELNGEQTILTYSQHVGVWGLEFFESGERFPEKWLGHTHWIDIS